jgi:hypothetical protein
VLSGGVFRFARQAVRFLLRYTVLAKLCGADPENKNADMKKAPFKVPSCL